MTENYVAYDFSSFSKAFYTMIVAISTTNFTMALAKGLSINYELTAFFFILNSFVVNFILLKLMMAVFFFYYQNFYTQNVKNMVSKKNLFRY